MPKLLNTNERVWSEGWVRVCVVCPTCGYNLNEITRDDPAADMLVAPLHAACDSCGAEFRLSAAVVQDAQHECLRILGEA